MKTYIVLSPIKIGGQIREIGSTVDLAPEVAAKIPAGRIKVQGDKLDELLEKTPAVILEAVATMPLDEISDLGEREQARGPTAREELLGGLMKAYATRRREADQEHEQERAREKEKADAGAKAAADAEAKAKAESDAKAKADHDAKAKAETGVKGDKKK